MGFALKMLQRVTHVVLVAFLCFAAGTSEPLGFDSELEVELTAQMKLAVACSGTNYAHVCSSGAIMLFTQTMFSACTPLGCAYVPGASEDHEAFMRQAVVQQRAASLAEEQPGTSLKGRLQFQAVAFKQAEDDNRFRIAKIMKMHPDKRDLPALHFVFEEAVHMGFVHKEFRKAARALEWNASPTEVVLIDQLRLRIKCGPEADYDYGCSPGSFALLGGCEVATCMHNPGIGDNPSMLAVELALPEALEKAVPALSKVTDLKQFNRVTKAMAKQREKDSTDCNKAIERLLREGRPRKQTEMAGRAHRNTDLSALRLLVERAQYEGYSGRGVTDGKEVLDAHMAEEEEKKAALYRATLEFGPPPLVTGIIFVLMFLLYILGRYDMSTHKDRFMAHMKSTTEAVHIRLQMHALRTREIESLRAQIAALQPGFGVPGFQNVPGIPAQ